MWMTFRESIHSKVQLKKRNWAGQEECKLCGREESTDHLLFQCPVACFLWVFIKESLGWPLYPSRCEDLCVFLKSCKSRKTTLFICAGAMWVLWKTRNDWVFNNKLISSPNVLPHKIIGFLQHWIKLKATKDLIEREKTLGRLKEGLRLIC